MRMKCLYLSGLTSRLEAKSAGKCSSMRNNIPLQVVSTLSDRQCTLAASYRKQTKHWSIFRRFARYRELRQTKQASSIIRAWSWAQFTRTIPTRIALAALHPLSPTKNSSSCVIIKPMKLKISMDRSTQRVAKIRQLFIILQRLRKSSRISNPKTSNRLKLEIILKITRSSTCLTRTSQTTHQPSTSTSTKVVWPHKSRGTATSRSSQGSILRCLVQPHPTPSRHPWVPGRAQRVASR